MDKPEKIGALWHRPTRTGKDRYTGNITINGTTTKLVAWVNDKGDNPKRPDLVIYEDTWEPPAKSGPGDGTGNDPF